MHAPRTFRAPSQVQVCAWTGTIFKITRDEISKSVTQEKWDKGKEMIERLRKLCEAAMDLRPMLNRKELERETGFLNHLGMTFEVLVPYLKGYYFTLNSWRSHRDEADWKMTDKRWRRMCFDRFESGDVSRVDLNLWLEGTDDDENAPVTVKASPSVVADVRALSAIFMGAKVPVVRLRCRRVLTVIFWFGDASGTGLGATFTCGSGFNFRIGVWGFKGGP